MGGLTDTPQAYLRTRGCELPGGSNYVLLAELYSEQISPWNGIVSAHLSGLIEGVSSWLQNAVAILVSEPNVRRTVQNICSRWVAEARVCAFEELSKLEDDEKRQPSTENHYYTDNVQKSRADSFKEAVQAGVRDAADEGHFRQITTGYAEDRTKAAGALFTKIQSHLHVNMDDQAATEALISLEAYYKVRTRTYHQTSLPQLTTVQVAMKTFVDNVCRQVIERHLIAPLPNVFSASTVARFTDEELLRIGAESKEQTQRRDELATRAQVLRLSLAELQMS